jgi:chaperonin GroES
MGIESSLRALPPINGMTQPKVEPDLPMPNEEVEATEDTGPEKSGNYAQDLAAQVDDNNIARHLDADTLQEIAQLVVKEYEIDENSRAEWKSEAEQALKFATQESEPKQYPWPKASNIIYPLITSASLQFNARAYPAIIQNRNVVKGVVWGNDEGTPATQDGKIDGPPVIDPETQEIQWLIKPGEKTMRASKIGEHMSWQLLDEMPEWESQTDQLLTQLPIVGGAVRKTYWDFGDNRSCSALVPLMNIVWNKHAASFEKAPRVTEILTLYPHEVKEKELADETFLPISYYSGDDADGEYEQASDDSEAPRIYLEQHRRYDLDGDGYPEPYVITVHKGSSQVVRIVARYEQEGIRADDAGNILSVEPVDYYTLYPFLPDPKGGSYPVGFGHLLKPMNEAINTTLNQMFDAGHLQIAGGGFIGTSLSLSSGPTAFRLGEYIPVNNKGQSIRDSVFPLPFPGPSQTLFELLGFLVQAAEKTASVQDILTGDTARLADTQPTTLLALIEQGMKVYTAIYKRIYRALKGEFVKLYRLNRLYLAEDTRFKVGNDWKSVSQEDYRQGGGVEPIADPTMVTDMQKMARAGVLMPLAADPQIDHTEVLRRYLEAADIPGIDKLIKPPQDPMQNPLMRLEMAMKQAELGRTRAQELQFQSAAFLNMANAKTVAGEAEMAFIDKQLEMMRIHIESVNASISAAQVDAQMEGHASRERVAEMQLEAAKAKATSPHG